MLPSVLIVFVVVVVVVVVVVSGQHLLRKLVKAGIKCSFVLIDAVSYIMKEVL